MSHRLAMTRVAAIAVAAALVASPAAAQIVGPTYPAPGGNTATSAGSAIQSSGRTVRYGTFDPSQFSELYWTYQTVSNPWVSSPGSATGNMAFTGYNASTGIATWSSTANTTFFNPVSNSTVSFATFLDVQIQPISASVGPIGSGFLVPTTAGAVGIAGLPASQIVYSDAAGTDFQVWSKYTALSASGPALGDYYNSFNHIGGAQLNTSSSGAFYSEAVVAAPEPASVALVATGLVALGGLVRRRKNS
jgi:hypothetical protein